MSGTLPSCAQGALAALSRLARFSFLALTVLLTAGLAHGADITWGGNYRVEGFNMKNPELGTDQTTQGGQSSTAYVLHHLTLLPKLVVGDGLTLYSRLDILNNQNTKAGIDSTGRVYSTAGDLLGEGPGSTPSTTGTSTSTTSSDSNALSNTEMSGTIAVTELYFSWAQEFGQLLVGRMPMQFGLGIAFSAGNGLFDHYVNTKDAIAYKVIFGNLSVMPVVGKVRSGPVGEQGEIYDYMMQVQYENPETELQLGGFYQLRTGTFGANDYPLNGNIGGGDIGAGGTVLNGNPAPTTGGVTKADGFKSTLIGIFSTQKVGNLKIGVEANMLSGDSGLKDKLGNGVSINAYGIAAEVGWSSPESKLAAMLKMGIASGDDPGTTNVYEGYQFNRNYDVGLLLFNHPLGQQDFLRTGTVHDNSVPVRNQLDTEAISNAIYFAPSFQYHVKDTFAWGATLVYGMLNKDPIISGTAPNQGSPGTSLSLGEELDLNVTWKPMERLTWITTVGSLLPGQAWQAGSLNYTNSIAYGIETKAAISF